MLFKKPLVIRKPSVRRLTVEAICDSDISYRELEEVVKDIRKKFNGDADCKISSIGGNICIVMTKGQKPERTLFEELYVGGSV